MAHLSDIELYYSDPDFIKNDRITLQGEEFHHSVNVMRNSVGDSIYITDGKGKIYNCEINEIDKNELKATIQSELEFENTTADIWFCIPVLKNPDRLKFALEKCVELGITNFILFTSKRTIPKKINTDKIEKITVAAMKQSLRAFLPNITSAKFEEVIKLQGEKILFEQSAEKDFSSEIISSIPIYFLFGPEGGFDESEINLIHTAHRYRLSTNRLRSETAIIKCASLLTFP